MKFTRLAVAIAALSAGTAFAAPTFVVPGGTVVDPFGGIDWASTGTAYTTNFNQATASSTTGGVFDFTTTYFAYANPGSGIQLTSGSTPFLPNLQGGAAPVAGTTNPFELTTVATLNERATCAGGSCTFLVTGGAFNVYLDPNVDSRIGAAASLSQYNNGTLLISGVITSGGSTAPTANNSGQFTINGTVVSTNSAYITPGLDGTSASGTLQLGATLTNYSRPGFVGGDTCVTGGTGVDLRSCTLVFQADANQRFGTQVPVPGTLALLGAAVAGLGFTARRRTAR